MPQQLRNPIPGSLHPWALSKRITDFLLALTSIISVGVSRRIFARIVRRQTGLLDPEMLPNGPRRIALFLCSMGTITLFAAITLMLSSQWGTFPVLACACLWYFLSGVSLSQGVWGLRGAFRAPPGRFAGILRRVWQVIRDELP
jgi:hypothetical protein